MKPDIHPKYAKSAVRCACGSVFETRSTKPEILVEICSVCHPFYTGKKRTVDTTGRVERFEKLMAKKKAKPVKSRLARAKKTEKTAAAPADKADEAKTEKAAKEKMKAGKKQ